MIYDITNANKKDLLEDLEIITSMSPHHISWYGLEMDNFTYKKELEKMDNNPLDELLMIQEYLGLNGYKQYELSNWSRPLKRSKHNFAYWSQKNYIGLGPGAVGTIDGNTRYTNHKQLKNYIQSLDREELPISNLEKITKNEKINELIMLSLRLIEGLNLKKFEKTTNLKIIQIKGDIVEKYKNYIKIENGYLKMKPEGWNFFNTIVGDLFL